MEYETIMRAGGGRGWLLLVHGMLASRALWAPNLARLGAAHNLVLVDLPAHGATAAAGWGRGAGPETWHPDGMVARLDAIRAELGIARWAVCGQSFGAGLTVRYALHHPERVVAQVLTNARTVFRDESDAAEQAARDVRAARLRTEGRAALRDERFHPRFAKRFPPELRERLSADADAMDLEGYARLLEWTLPQASLREQVRDCVVPSLLVNGRHERLFQPVREAMGGLWPGLEIVDLDGGHAVNIENPEGFDTAVLAFLARQEWAGAGRG